MLHETAEDAPIGQILCCFVEGLVLETCVCSLFSGYDANNLDSDTDSFTVKDAA